MVRKSRREKLLRKEDVHSLETPIFHNREDGPKFSLTYTDSGAAGGLPMLVVIPGGPGFASVLPYAFYRPRIARAGFRVVMVEHRGVGLSRHDLDGQDLPMEAMRVEYAAQDVLAVLDYLGVDKVWLHGTSYGGYLAQVVGMLAPERVAGMFLDTTMSTSEDAEVQRTRNRNLFLRGESPETAEIAVLVNRLLDSGRATDEELTQIVPPVYEFLGPRVLERLLSLVEMGHRTEWEYLHRQLRKELDDQADPFVLQFDLAGAIWFRELVPDISDGETFDTAGTFSEKAGEFPPFEGEPLDARRHLSEFHWPVVLFSGSRDTREPALLHRRMASQMPNALHVVFPEAAHDLLRFRTKRVLEIEQAATRGGLSEAASVATRAATDSPLHPQHVVSRIAEIYLTMVKYGTRRPVIRGAKLLALITLAALAWRARSAVSR